MKYEYVRMSSVEDAEKYSAEIGHWVVANVRQQVGWPEHKIIVYFRDVPLLFMPEKDNGYPAIAVCCKNGVSEGQAKEVINHFLSSMSWSTEKTVEIECLTGGGRPYERRNTKKQTLSALIANEKRGQNYFLGLWLGRKKAKNKSDPIFQTPFS